MRRELTVPRKGKTVRHALPVIVRKTIESIASGYAPKRIWLYGSFARGDVHEGSDLDLIIIKETTRRFPDRIEEVLQSCPGGHRRRASGLHRGGGGQDAGRGKRLPGAGLL